MRTLVPVLATLVLFVGILVSPPSSLAAAEANPWVVETTSYFATTQRLPVGDIEGHFLGLGSREGVATLPGGEQAKYYSIYTFDFQRNGGPITGYSKIVCDDGSMLVCSFTADVPIANGLFSKIGQGTIKGTGRFDGKSGTVVINGKQLKSAAEDPRMPAATTYRITFY